MDSKDRSILIVSLIVILIIAVLSVMLPGISLHRAQELLEIATTGRDRITVSFPFGHYCPGNPDHPGAAVVPAPGHPGRGAGPPRGDYPLQHDH